MKIEGKNSLIQDEDSLFLKQDDRQHITSLLFKETEELTNAAVIARQRFEQEKRELISGEHITVENFQEEFKRYIAECEKNHEPKFSLFLTRLGNLCKWTEEEKSRYSKPRIAAVTINEVIYMRFPDGLLKHIQFYNKFVGFFVRRTKNYKLLNDEGILKLEEYIDNANTVMLDSKDYYDFRKKMYAMHQVPYQIQLFAA